MKKYVLLLLVFLILTTSCSQKDNVNKDDATDKKNDSEIIEKVEDKKLGIVNLESDSRPVAVMINNHPEAVPNHAGLQDAYITYEIIVEGGLTRLMAVFKDKDTARLGSVRSARPYFLDYVLENDAIYTHFGYSKQAQIDIPNLNINNVNGLVDNGFWRDSSLNVAYEHTAFISMENILNTAKNKGYRLTTTDKPILNYTVKEIDLSKIDNSKVANNILINYSSHQNTSYVYDETIKKYKRFVKGEPHIDGITKEQYVVKNILVLKVQNYSNDGYLQILNNIGNGDGYYITDGYAIPIKWHKESRASKTTYTDLSGNEVLFNDGNTFIQIQPINQQLTIN